MATSGQVNTNTTYDSYFWVKWEQDGDQDIANNRTKIKWSCGVYCGHSFYSNAIRMSAVIINGIQVYGGGTYSNLAHVNATLASGSMWIDHNSDGTKTFSISSFTGWLYSNNNYSSNGDSFDLTAIPRISKPTVSKDTLDFGETVTIYTNRKSTNFVHKLWYKYGSSGWIEITPTASVTDSYDWTVPESLMKQIPNRQSLDITIGCDTYYNSGIYVDEDYAYITANVPKTTIPTVSMDVALNNSSLPSQFDGMYIQGKSKVNVSITATGKYDATIIVKDYSASIDGKAYFGKTITSDAIQNSGSIKIVGYAKDSRGFTGSTEQTISVVEHSKPQVIPIGSENSILCYRSDGNGKRVGASTSVWIKAKRSYYSLSGKNGCALRLRWKKATEVWNDGHDWNNLIASTNTTTDEYNALIPGTFDLKESYTIQIQAIDDIGEYDIKTLEVPTQDVALHLGKGGKNVAIGTYCDYSEERTFYSEWKAIFGGGVMIGDKSLKDYIKDVINGGG